MRIALTDAASAMGCSAGERGVEVRGWSVDSRTVQAGDLFFALRGPVHDGHEYVARAIEAGAVAAVVDRPVDAAGPLLRVGNCYTALQALAAWARRRWGGRVVAVTGSAGKTTTKDAIAHLLGKRFRVGKTVGNFNNHVGLPLSLLRMAGDTEIAVIEIGMNHPGEIWALANIAQPGIGVVTNVGRAHMENFDSIEGIARAKRELIDALPENGTAILNADDERVLPFRDGFGGKVVTFGFGENADVRVDRVERVTDGTRFLLRRHGWFHTPLEGRHGVLNALAALAVARAFGLEAGELIDRVLTLSAGDMRGMRRSHRGITIFDDCYNSNPDAARAMLDIVRDTPARQRIAVLGEMLELGRWTETLHQEIGRYVAACGVNVLVGIRGAARLMVDAAVQAGLPASAAYFFHEPSEAGGFLKELAREGDVMLFKGSRGIHVEQALERFLAEDAAAITAEEGAGR